MKHDTFISKIQDIVYNYLEKRGFFIHEWHLGKVAKVNSDNTLNIFIDGSSTATPCIPANPDVNFNPNDYVWVHYVNRNPNNLFIPYKRHITS